MQKKYLIILSKIFIFLFIFIIGGLIINFLFFHKNYNYIENGHFEKAVYITKTGECYHSKNCSYINRKKQIGINQAKDKGYRKCKHCNAISYDFIWVKDIQITPEENNYKISFILSFSITSLINFVYIIIKVNKLK